ncbi:MAG: PQQ-binding-like beta-propeller repeat protein [Planctomycetaceae bacterium]|nr:PQQ-binding-like beta-propeller repeat protein [Planctomycetaceae bacterium]
MTVSPVFKTASFLALLGAATSLPAADWPQFRGPNCSGIAVADVTLPTEFSTTKNVAWSADVGEGIGGAVVAAGRVFVNGMTSDHTVSLFAFDAKTGKSLWRRDWETGELCEIHQTNSQAPTTPVADDERVYLYFTTLGMLCVDAETGKDVWQYDLPVPFFVFKWGPGMSPVLHKDLLLFCQDDDLNPAFYAFDKRTGDLRWRDDRIDQAVNYSHPVVCTVDGVDEVVVAGTGMLIGYDPETGRRKWFAKVLLRNIKTTPVALDGVIYITVQSGGIANQWLASIDRATTGNNDNRLDREETQAFVGKQKIPEAFFERTFVRGDLNKDGFLEGKELDIAFLHPDNFAGADYTKGGDDAASQYVLAVRGGGSGDVTETHLLYKHPTKHTDHIVSPHVANGRILTLKEGGIVTSFDATTGETYGRTRRVGSGGSYFASPVLADGKIFFCGENGHVIVLKDDPEFEELADNDFGESILATPAITEDGMFLRTRHHVYCVRNLEEKDKE